MPRLIIVLIIALWVFYDARKNGLNSFAALSWAIILGASGISFQFLIFLPLYFIFGRKKVSHIRRDCSQGEVIDVEATILEDKMCSQCSSCGRDMKDEDTICPHCSSKVKL